MAPVAYVALYCINIAYFVYCITHRHTHTHWVNAILFVILCYRDMIISEKRHLVFLVYRILPNIPYCFSDAKSFDEKLWNAQYFDKECSQIR